jgi:hypothetical protein
MNTRMCLEESNVFVLDPLDLIVPIGLFTNGVRNLKDSTS